MPSFLKRVRSLPRKLSGSFDLLRRDPEALARNLLQFTNRPLFEQRLIDVMHAAPMHVRVETDRTGPPRLNVLDSQWTQSGMTGGPNTVINLAFRIAREGIAVRLVSTVKTSAIDPGWFARHAEALVGGDRLPEMPIVSAAEPDRPLELGPGDAFLATHWTTAQQLKDVLPLMPIRQFFYMLQEFEPGFYPWSSNYARAIETYGMDFWPIVNEAMLAEYLFGQPIGRLSDPATASRAVVFEPAVDEKVFHIGSSSGQDRRKRLLFYARPTNTRNMFGLGLMALRQIAAEPAFEGWEFLSIGSRGSIPDLPLGNGQVLRRAPWMDYAGYGDLLRRSDLMLCPMLSPHTSYPVLEMAACGGLSITNVFATKTAARLQALSRAIIAVEPTVTGLADGLLQGARTINAGARTGAPIDVARNWDAVLDPAARRVAAIVREMSVSAGSVDGRQ